VGGIGGMVPVFGKTKVKHNLKGSKSAVRVKTTTPEIEVFIASNLNPSDQIILVKFTAKSEAREIETSRTSAFGSKSGFTKAALIATTFEEVKDRNSKNDGYILYRVKVVTPLVPGEYAYVSNGYYDFGIEQNTSK
jgi:hypothetical protein